MRRCLTDSHSLRPLKCQYLNVDKDLPTVDELRFSPEGLRRAFTHLNYELMAFLADAQDLSTDAVGSWRTEVLEAFLVHARAIAYFLDVSGRYLPDDVTPRDFGVTWDRATVSKISGADNRLQLEAQMVLINKHLAHLTWDRARELPGVEWDYMRLPALLNPLVEAFVEALAGPHPTYAASLKARLDAYRQWSIEVAAVGRHVGRTSYSTTDIRVSGGGHTTFKHNGHESS